MIFDSITIKVLGLRVFTKKFDKVERLWSMTFLDDNLRWVAPGDDEGPGPLGFCRSHCLLVPMWCLLRIMRGWRPERPAKDAYLFVLAKEGVNQ